MTTTAVGDGNTDLAKAYLGHGAGIWTWEKHQRSHVSDFGHVLHLAIDNNFSKSLVSDDLGQLLAKNGS